MLFMREVHKVKGAKEDDFEATYRDGWMPMLAKNCDLSSSVAFSAAEARRWWSDYRDAAVASVSAATPTVTLTVDLQRRP